MNMVEAIAIVLREWDAQGHCASCGWHAALGEYGDLTEAIDINEQKGRIEMSCLSKDDDGSTHRGVRIYYQRVILSGGEHLDPPT